MPNWDGYITCCALPASAWRACWCTFSRTDNSSRNGSGWGLIGVGVWAILYAFALINPAFLPGAWIDLVWMVILAIGVGLQSFRYQHTPSERERQQIRRMGLTLLMGVAVYIVLWLIQLFLPPSFMIGAGGIWFTMISDLMVDAVFLYFGLSLMLSTREDRLGCDFLFRFLLVFLLLLRCDLPHLHFFLAHFFLLS